MSHSASVNQHFGCRFLFRKGKTIFAYSSFLFTEMALVVEALHHGRQRTTILPWLPAEYLYGGNVRNQGISRPDMNIFSCRNNLVLAAECSPFIREAVKIGIIWSFTYICLDIVILPMSRGCKLPIYSVMITSLMYDNGVTWWRHQMETFSALHFRVGSMSYRRRSDDLCYLGSCAQGSENCTCLAVSVPQFPLHWWKARLSPLKGTEVIFVTWPLLLTWFNFNPSMDK